jgi:HSP20 family molecular chaperone IbpA
MSAQEASWVPVCIAETILEELEETYDQITKRAYEIFQERGGICTMDLDDWLTAEHELLFKPPVHFEETDQGIKVTTCVGKVGPLDLQLLVTPDAMVIRAGNSAVVPKVFRTFEFPRRIDVSKTEARYANGYLVVTASCLSAKS